jgi:nitrogen-specific signal transduction histidine kinase
MTEMRSDGIRQLLDLLPAIVAFIDRDGRVGWGNKAYYELSQHLKPTVPAETISGLFSDQQDTFLSSVKEVTDSGLAKTGILATVDIPGDEPRTMKCDLMPCTGRRETGWVILFACDISEQVELERMKKDAYEQIEKNIEQFAILGDHIRNPVSVIIGFCDLLEGDVNWPEVVKALREVGYQSYLTAEMIPTYRFCPEVRLINTARAMDGIMGRK